MLSAELVPTRQRQKITLMIMDKMNRYFTMQEMAGDNQKEAYTGFILILKLSRMS